MPLQDTEARPDKESATLPETEAGDAVSAEPFAGELMLNVGAVRSMFNVTWAVAVFPAVSTAVPDMT